MVQADFALIGGTGIGERLAAWGGSPVAIPTSFGLARGRIIEREGLRLLAVQRHAKGHRLPPHRVPYAAMATALARIGVKGCISSAAVGCLRAEWPVGTMVVCRDFLDLSGRRITLFADRVQHAPMAEALALSTQLESAASQLGIPVQTGAVYLNLDGPRYESSAEIRMMKGLGADLVGMTAGSEAICFAEAGVPYGCLAVVTNLAEGLSDAPIAHHAVTDVMKERGETVLNLMVAAARRVVHGD